MSCFKNYKLYALIQSQIFFFGTYLSTFETWKYTSSTPNKREVFNVDHHIIYP